MFRKLVGKILMRIIQMFWTTVTLFGMGLQIVKTGSNFWKKVDHPKPRCLEGWDSRYVQLKNIKLHYVQTGSDDKPLFLMVHGFPEFWYSWRFQLRHFQNDYRCVAIDQRGYNLSDRPKDVNQYHMDILANDIKEVIEALGYKNAIVAAHDWGAIVCWRAAMMYPEMISRLIICNVPHPRAFSKSLAQFMKSWYMFMFQSPYIPELAMKNNDYGMIRAMFRGAKGGLKNKENFTDEDLEAWKHCFSQHEDGLTPPINYYRSMPKATPLSQSESIVKMPTLIVWGVEDAFIEKDSAKRSLDFCKNGQLFLVNNASHWVQQDAPQQVNERIQQFLQQTNDNGSSKL